MPDARSALLTSFDLRGLPLPNRVVMAPMTRSRGGVERMPNALNAEYYAQRADPATGAGLLITEATQVCPEGQGYLDTPGIHSAEQVARWRRITDAVHARGGRIVVQLWHVGRISHVSLQPGGQAPVSRTRRGRPARRPTSPAASPPARRRVRWPPKRFRAWWSNTAAPR